MIIAAIKEFFGAAKAVAKDVGQRDAELNTPQAKAGVEASEIQADRAAASKAITAPNLDEIRKETAE
jgi:hypothetical protein